MMADGLELQQAASSACASYVAQAPVQARHGRLAPREAACGSADGRAVGALVPVEVPLMRQGRPDLHDVKSVLQSLQQLLWCRHAHGVCSILKALPCRRQLDLLKQGTAQQLELSPA